MSNKYDFIDRPLLTEGRPKTPVAQPNPDKSHAAVKPSKTPVAQPSKPAKKLPKKPVTEASKRKTKCIAIKADGTRCKYNARDGAQTCGVKAHRRQASDYESSNEADSDEDA